MRRPLFLFVCALAATIGILAPRLLALPGGCVGSPSDGLSASPETMALTALGDANARRADRGMARLEELPELQILLDEHIRGGGARDLQTVFGVIAKRIPRCSDVSGFLFIQESGSPFLDQFRDWPEVTEPGHTHLAVHCFKAGRGLVGCLAVLGTMVPELRLPMRCADTPRFFDVCPSCGHGHIVAAWQGASVLRCPGCRQPYDLLGADSDGYWRRASDFVAAEAWEGATPSLEDVAKVWREVTTQNRYQLDVQRLGGGDSWNLPEETMRHGFGDCDDTSILLAHLLVSRGVEARVALGSWEGVGHAWVVVRVGGEGYLLESTLAGLAPDALPPKIETVALDYLPEAQFDGGSLYFKRFEGWTGEYWSDGAWTRVESKSGGTRL